MKREDGNVKERGMGRRAYRNASEASVGTTESLRDALSGIAPRIREAASWDEDSEEQMKAAERLGEAQFVYWERIPDDLLRGVLDAGDPEKLDEYLTRTFLPDGSESFFDIWVGFPEGVFLPHAYGEMVSQSEACVMRGAYEIACVGLCSVIDGLLSDFSTVFGEGLNSRLDDMAARSEEEVGAWDDDDSTIVHSVFLVSFAGAMGSFGEGASFALKEPKTLNRIWITHGRARRKKTMLDCLKLLRMIHGILMLKEMCEDEWL